MYFIYLFFVFLSLFVYVCRSPNVGSLSEINPKAANVLSFFYIEGNIQYNKE